MKIGIVTIAAGEGFAERVKIATENTREYCDRWKIDFHLITDIPGKKKHKHFSTYKLPVMGDLLPGYDWLLWLDADGLIMDHRIPLETWVQDVDRHFVFSPDLVHGMNCGIWLAKNTAYVHGKLKEWFRMPEHPSYWEQPGMNQAMDMSTVHVNDRLHAICYLGNWHSRTKYFRHGYHWIAHLAGRRNDKIIPDLKHYAKYIKR
jgi:hypothetical protein